MSEAHDKAAVIVTGAASGIGLGVVKSFAERGHPVAMLDRNQNLLDREAAAITAAGGRVFARAVDVVDRAAIDDAYAAARRELGPLLIVVANAGVSIVDDFLTMTAESWQHTIDVNLTGVFHTVQAALPDMVAAKWGRIVTISSQAAQSGSNDRAHYAASKGGVIGLTRSIARELAPHGITANTIPPSLVDTPMARAGAASGQVPPLDEIARAGVPLGRPGTPADIGEACVFLASEGASYITGQTLGVNGGTWM